jgi:hypothetical protein
LNQQIFQHTKSFTILGGKNLKMEVRKMLKYRVRGCIEKIEGEVIYVESNTPDDKAAFGGVYVVGDDGLESHIADFNCKTDAEMFAIIKENQLSPEQTTKQAEQIANAVNSMTFRPKAVAEKMLSQHKTLQQLFTGLCLAWLWVLATDERVRTDGRNQASVDAAKEIYARCQVNSDLNVLEEPLPFI